ncbi:hypothetical protein Hs30E_17840 [Lactococcus hodotermopsidis]|uniref:Uncharacterized protein n=1 Tax=Pseudolactococcus hodotermopsidis TaxID=2709157 RepID=A0A6A0BEV7_9LACT|nr:cell wall-active antibiotics response protein LiaF [Lactococcus hodotermopsidis]GFH43233.1 hypothetical protein Hs30E_17840 [Lactococcus hodotermopsidis]
MTKFKFFIIIEIILLFLLSFSLLKNPFFLFVLVIGLFLAYLSMQIKAEVAQKVLRQIAAGFGIIALIMFVANGYTWLVLLFPVIVAIIFWRTTGTTYTSVNTQNHTTDNFERRAIFDNQSDNSVSRMSGNDVIDLAFTEFKSTGNDLSIKKASGNTKIIVPDDVAVILDVTAVSGVVKIFDDITRVNAEHVRYMSDDFGASDKRIRIMVKVLQGNVEVIKG